MLSFPIAYLVVWFGVLVYVLRLGAKHRQLLRNLEALQKRTGDRLRVQGSGFRVQDPEFRPKFLNREPLTVRGNKPPGSLICPLPPVP